MRASFMMRVFGLLVAISVNCVVPTQGQDMTTAPATARKPAARPSTQDPGAIDNEPRAPQVVTILHRLSGLKMIRLMARSDEEALAVAKLDEAFKIMDGVHTSVIAGLALNDGETIVAWLPEAEAELAPPLLPFAPGVSPPQKAPSEISVPPNLPAVLAKQLPSITGDLLQPPDVTVVARNGKRFLARYIGLDGVTGLSVLKFVGRNFLPGTEAKTDDISVGQRLHLFAPEPTTATTTSGGTISVRVGEIDGTITNITQAPSGGLFKIRISSAHLSPANIGGIAVNEAFETVGIVETIDKGEASLLSTVQIRNAARRVLEKQSSVPRPWLGVSGQPIASLDTGFLLNNGWRQPQAVALTQERCGILLTRVAPDSPAAVAALRPGDVILRVNGEDIRSADDFSWSLQEVGPGGSVNFTVMRPGHSTTEAVNLKLSGALDSGFGSRFFDPNSPRSKQGLLHQGIETIALKPTVAERFFGAHGGLLVVYVQSATGAYKAGLRPGDVIETIDGQHVPTGVEKFASSPGATLTFEVVRGRQRFTLSVVNTPE